ncbi:MAG: YgjV family protein [Clostridiales bacterium]
MFNIITQIIGLFGFISIVYSFQNNDRRKILYFQILGNILFCLHFYLIGSPTGSAMNFLGIVRGLLFNQRNDKKWADNVIFMYIFLFVFSLAGYLTWEGIFSFLPTLGAVIGTIGLWIKNPSRIRTLCLIASPCWLIYNIHSNSIAGILTETFVTVSIIVAIVRFDFLKSINS